MKSKKIDKQYVLFFLLIITILFGGLSPITTIVAMALTMIISIILITSIEYNHNTCIGIILLLCFQNFCIGLGAHLASNTSINLRYLTQIPFIVIFMLFANLFLKNCKKNIKSKTDKFFIIYILAIIFSFMIGRGNINSILINIRNMTVFYMAYYIGKYSITDKKNLDKYFISFQKISLIVVFVGIILLFGGYKLYSSIGIDEVYIAKGSSSLLGGFSGRFYTEIGHIAVQRMGSLYYEPVNLSYFLSIAFLFALFYKIDNKKYLTFIIIDFMGLILSFGKGGIMVAGAAIAIMILIHISKKLLFRFNEKKGIKRSIFIIICFMVVFCIYYYQHFGGSVKPHFWGLIQTWQSVISKPWGHGLGTGGNMATLFDSSKNWLSSGGESGIMSFIYQYGFQGILLFVLCFIGTSPSYTKNNNFIKLCIILPYILLSVALLQENTFTPQCIVPFMIVLEGANNYYKGELDEK